MKARLLLVDDEEPLVEALSERLSMRDYDVTTSLTGEDAIEKIENYNTEDLTAKIDKAHDRKAEHEDRIRTAKISHATSSPRSVLNDL